MRLEKSKFFADWFALDEGSGGSQPEGTSAEWRAIADAIERGDSASFKRCAARRFEHGWILSSPRNSMTADLLLPSAEAAEFVLQVREVTAPLAEMTEPQLKVLMREAMEAVAGVLPAGTLFTVLAWDAPGLAQYGSNAQRAEVIQALRETADRLASREETARVPFDDEPQYPQIPGPEAAR